jgi:glycosyltransferase involved in cell wall biosynthesis
LPIPDAHTISVVIPVRNGAHTLRDVLSALAQTNPAPHEIVIVDDSSSDESAVLAEKMGCRVIRLPQHVGAAAAKNCGAANAQGDILFFTDADILLPPDTFARLARIFHERRCDAVVGLLAPDIPAQDFASQFKNLWMNFTYARFASADRIGLFYTSAAAIRRDRFLELGGFDENYRGASIAEDTEFGQRAWGRGAYILLDPRLRVVHLKAYTVSSVLREDLRRARALTLMRLRKWGQPFFTSVPLFYQLAVPVIYVALFAGAIAYHNPLVLFIALGLLLTFYLLNSPFLVFLLRERGIVFVAKSLLLLPLDVIVVGVGIVAACADFVRGKRY